MNDQGDHDRLFLDAARECGQALEQAEKIGLKVSAAKLVRDKGLLFPKQVVEVRRALRKQGVLVRLGKYEIISKLGQGGRGGRGERWKYAPRGERK